MAELANQLSANLVRMLKGSWQSMIAFIGYVALGILYWFPLSLHLRTRIFDASYGDSAFNMWILGWGNHTLTHAPWRFFEAPMFHPYPHVLAWGDNLFSTTLVTLPLVPIVGLLGAYNFILLMSSVLCGYCLYLLVSYLVKNRLVAFLAGAMWMLSYARTAQAYIQVLPLWWLPLIFLITEKVRRGDYNRSPWWLTVVVFMQLTTGIYAALYTVIAFGIYSVCVLLLKRPSKQIIKLIAKHWLIAGLIAIPVYAPSIILNILRPTVRGLSEQSSLSLSDLSPLSPPSILWHDLALKLHLIPSARVAQFSLGILLSLLVTSGTVYGAIKLFRHKAKLKDVVIPLAFLLIGLFALLASLGPTIQLTKTVVLKNVFFIAPYLLVPGFKVMRLTLRWQFIALFALSIFASFLLAKLLKHVRPWLQVVIIALAIGAIIIEQVPWNEPGQSKAPQLNSAPVYEWLSKQPGNFAIAELPIYPGVYYGKNDLIEGRRLYFQTMSGWHPRVSGAYSPFIPDGYAGPAGLLNGLGGDPEALARAKEIGITYILFLPQDYIDLGWGEEAARAKLQQLDSAPYLRGVFRSPQGSVYQIR